MKLKGNTVLIIGGSAGIGKEIAIAFHELGNKVIITGRSKDRLNEVVNRYPNIIAISNDMTSDEETNSLIAQLEKEFPQLKIVINNAAIAHYYSVAKDGRVAYDKAFEEINTNYLSIIRLTGKILPLLKRQDEAAIVNVSSIAAMVPSPLVGYSASKAALHSYTQSLRYELSKEFPSIKVFELQPSLVNTDATKSMGWDNGISPDKVAKALIDGMEKDTYEIRVGYAEELYKIFLSSPESALTTLRSLREKKTTI